MSDLSQALPADSASKILLLCNHAEELSKQCATAIKNRAPDQLLDWQSRKGTVVSELASMLRQPAVANVAEVRVAVDKLREVLREEMRLLTQATDQVQSEIQTVNAAHRRLTQARHYDNGEPPKPGGTVLSVSG